MDEIYEVLWMDRYIFLMVLLFFIAGGFGPLPAAFGVGGADSPRVLAEVPALALRLLACFLARSTTSTMLKPFNPSGIVDENFHANY